MARLAWPDEAAELITPHLGHRIDTDGAYGAQCADVATWWCAQLWGTWHIAPGALSAANFYAKRDRARWDAIPGWRWAPREGDVAVWGRSWGRGWGHVALVTRPSGVRGPIRVAQQDGFSQGQGVHALWQPRAGLIGGLRARKGRPRVHVVQSGETLSGIAARYGYTWQQLARLNQLRDPNVIHPGQRIRLP